MNPERGLIVSGSSGAIALVLLALVAGAALVNTGCATAPRPMPTMDGGKNPFVAQGATVTDAPTATMAPTATAIPDPAALTSRAPKAKATNIAALKKFYEERGIPMPDNLQIVQRDPNIPQALANLAPAQIGNLGGSTATFAVVIEKIRGGEVEIIYAFSSSPWLRPKWIRTTLGFKDGALFNNSLVLRPDGRGLAFEWRPTGPRSTLYSNLFGSFREVNIE